MSCTCHDAATRVYCELKRRGQSEGDAFFAAVQVFRSHHPQRGRIEALQTVADWLDDAEAGLPAPTAAERSDIFDPGAAA